MPPPTDIVAFTREEIPKDGIWEPEWKPSLQIGRALRGLPTVLDKGCMNYLVAGTKAPYYHNDPDESVFPVSWRLLWEDTRYKDGTIPEEEKEYLLTDPDVPG